MSNNSPPDAVQQMRIELRWEAIEQENKEYDLAREVGKPFVAHILEYGDTPKQILERNRHRSKVRTSGHQNKHIELKSYLPDTPK